MSGSTPLGSTWAGSHSYIATALAQPRSVPELQALVTSSPRLRALGSRHSFSDLADSPGVLVSLVSMPDMASLSGSTVRVPAGMKYGDLALWLHSQGRALANMASLPHISVAGAVATGTHGSGVANGSLAAAVTGLELVDGTGEVRRLARGDADFDGAVVGLGSLGVVTALELETEASYTVTQEVHEGLGWDDLLADPEPVLGAAYSTSVFTRWTGDLVGQVWTKSREGRVSVPGAAPASEQRHMIPGMDPTLTTEQLGADGPWHERIPHFRHGFLPSSGDEIQSEYLLPRSRAVEALEAMRGLADEIEPLLHVTELRTVAADRLWLSSAYDADVLAIHFTWRKEPERVAALLPRVEERLLPLGARPHWGKVFTAGATEIAGLYPRWSDFRGLCERFDPEGRFTNAWTARVLGL